MVTLGCDSHKQTHTLVAVDGNGRQLGSRTVAATSEGHLEAVGWARRWALEDCRHVCRRLELHPGLVARLASELADQIRDLTGRIKQLETEIARLMAELSPRLLELEGCGALTTAKIVGETAGVARFRSRAAYAMHSGSAPIPASSPERR